MSFKRYQFGADEFSLAELLAVLKKCHLHRHSTHTELAKKNIEVKNVLPLSMSTFDVKH